MLQCSLKESFGVECPSCGAQRSFIALIHGDVKESLMMFPALLPLILTFILTVLFLLKFKFAKVEYIRFSFVLSGILMLGNWCINLINH